MSSPILLVGSMGSGTTLARLMLDSHPDVMIAQETGFLRSLNAQYFSPFWLFGERFSRGLGLTIEEFDQHVRAFYDGVFTQAAQARGARSWGDKTPFHSHLMPLASRVFPDARFVVTVRHPGAVTVSMRRFDWTTSQAVNHWLRINQTLADQAAVLGNQTIFVRYEDLVMRSEPVMREILEFLELPWNESVLQHHVVQVGAQVEGGTRSDRAIDRTRVDAWPKELSARSLIELQRRTSDQARLWGYDIDEPLPSAPLVPASGHVTARGADLAAYQATFADVPRIEVRESFENGLLTREALGAELGRAWWAGAHGAHVRFPYREFVDATYDVPAPRMSVIARVRRRLARIIHPDW